jgi:hypothetical protein
MRLPCGAYDLALRSTQRLPISARARRALFLNLLTSNDFKLLCASRPTSLFRPLRVHGGRGRIRTSVARKERQIYSLLVLATHPPVLEKLVRHQTACPAISYRQTIQEREGRPSENTKRTRVKRHQPVDFALKDSLRSIPPRVRWWSWRRELNPRPSDYKSDALPAELRQRSQTDKE